VATKQIIYTNKKITVITTHINADFDAVASMLAAQKLYPGSVVVFPGSHEKSLRNFFISSMVYLFNIMTSIFQKLNDWLLSTQSSLPVSESWHPW